MARKISPFRLGLFIIVCGALGLGAVIWLGSSRYFEKTKTYVSYFNESVKGLQKDATVNYRGVAVGRVYSIGLAPDGRLIQVLMHLRPDFQVDEGLALQLREQGLTGMRSLEIDKAPHDLKKLTPHLSFEPPYPVIPAYPSELAQLKSALETLYAKINSLDLESLTKSWTETALRVNGILAGLEGAIVPEDWKAMVSAVRRTAEDASLFASQLSQASSPKEMKEGFKDLYAALDATRQTTESLSRQLKGLPPDTLTKMSKQWDDTIRSGGNLFSNLNRQVGESTALLDQSLQQLKILLMQMNALVQSVKEQPNRLVVPPEEPNPFKRK